MTWQECRDTSLQKLFQCYNGPDEDEATLRYLAAMPAAANEGIALLCAARPLRGVAELYTGLVGDQGICGHFNADRFACLLKRQACYTDTLFLRFGAQVNTLSNAKNVIMKWGIYPVTDRTLPVEHMCDRALLAELSAQAPQRAS